jgi:hypothetical protein
LQKAIEVSPLAETSNRPNRTERTLSERPVRSKSWLRAGCRRNGQQGSQP